MYWQELFILADLATFVLSNGLILYTRNGKVNLLRLEVDMVLSLQIHFHNLEPIDAGGSEHRHKEQRDHRGLHSDKVLEFHKH